MMKWEADFCDKRTANVVDIPRVRPTKEGHPTPKPVDLVTHFLRLHGKRNDVVCDSFAGAGSTCVAAKSLGMHYIACELDPHWHTVAEKRLKETVGWTRPRIVRSSALKRRERERTIPGPRRNTSASRIREKARR